ncbi:hypothetical protein SBOR_7983 [Sclerotinia borealis F-4128]|uniref:Uncharacterized protein n=1 Tax=Sclerotinia borealis (strain F-4128) TaxID=1432307 RepID=W9C6Y0_SCLBF|nr:hypothetical protein SBOR_7983 [Sclerotinia borealis F-4128]
MGEILSTLSQTFAIAPNVFPGLSIVYTTRLEEPRNGPWTIRAHTSGHMRGPRRLRNQTNYIERTFANVSIADEYYMGWTYTHRDQPYLAEDYRDR